MSDIKIERNMLSFTLAFLHFASIIARTVTVICESFWKVKSEKKFYDYVEEFEEIYRFSFGRKINFAHFKKILTRRLVWIVIIQVMSIVGDIEHRLSRHPLSFKIVYHMTLLFIDITTASLFLFKTCYYVDVIRIHLKAVHEIFDDFAREKHSKVKKILAAKKLYVMILEMTREFNHFVAQSLQAYIIETAFWLLVSNYRFLEIQFGLLERKKEFSKN